MIPDFDGKKIPYFSLSRPTFGFRRYDHPSLVFWAENVSLIASKPVDGGCEQAKNFFLAFFVTSCYITDFSFGGTPMKIYILAVITLLLSTVSPADTLKDKKCRPDDLNKGKQVCLASVQNVSTIVTGDDKSAMIWEIVGEQEVDRFITSARLLFSWQIVDGEVQGRPSNATNIFANATLAKDSSGKINHIEVDAGNLGKSSASGF